MGKIKYLSAFERGMVVGARCTGLSVSRTVTLLGFSRSTVSRIYHCGKHWSQHGPASLWKAFDAMSSPCPDELRLFWGQRRVQLNIRTVFLMFCTLSVCNHIDGFSCYGAPGLCFPDRKEGWRRTPVRVLWWTLTRPAVSSTPFHPRHSRFTCWTVCPPWSRVYMGGGGKCNIKAMGVDLVSFIYFKWILKSNIRDRNS